MKIKIFITTLLMIAFANTTKAQYSLLYNFPGPGGGGATANSFGAFISDGTFLYGMSSMDGTHSHGYIYKIKTDSSMYDTLLNFNVSNGATPYGSLLSDGTYLYGMTSGGGIDTAGSIFKIKPDGTEYIKLYDFDVTTGASPYGSLLSDGTYLYGMTNKGGVNNFGVIFKVKKDGTGYTKLLDFLGMANGSSPYGSLVSDGTFLYGMTYTGGANDQGLIFKIKMDGTEYADLYDFSYLVSGGFPYGSLLYDGIYLYGMTNIGGPSSVYGNVFKIKTDGTEFSLLVNFTGSNGYQPRGSLISDDTFLYGMAGGGSDNGGVVFRVKFDGTGYVKMHDFNITTGEWPYGDLFSDGSYVYGITTWGGVNNAGTIFKLGISTSAGIIESQLHQTMSVYPNPASQQINVKFSEVMQKKSILKITDLFGRELLSEQVNKQLGSILIDLTSLSAGIYFISMGNCTEKFIKE